MILACDCSIGRVVGETGRVGIVGIKNVCLFFGGGYSVVLCGDSLMSVRGIGVFVVEASDEPPEFGGICVE